MKTKLGVFLLSVALAATLFTGCGAKETQKSAPAEEPAKDVVTTASLVNQGDALVKALSKDGTWIAAILSDVKTDKEIIVDGEFHNKNDAAQDIYRKLGLYAQDADHKVTARYTLTAPKMTVKSPNFRIQSGTFVGDVYVEANGFNLKDAKVDGNVYFAKQEYKDSFGLDDKSSVTGAQEVK